eukprot:m.70707 g.70707  ORF g.70707 m.70707 type:complete len:81 (-) comp13786_c0_seq1:37-279(-)
MHWAAQNGDPMCVSYLLESKSTPLINYKDRHGLTCVHLAALGGHHNVLKVVASLHIAELRLTSAIFNVTCLMSPCHITVA